MPALEAAAYGIGAAGYGPEQAVLMGLSACRLLGVLPRAHAVAVVAVPKQRPALQLSDRPARVIFVRRDISRLDTERLPTELGSALVTSPEQTVLDLAHRPQLGGMPDEVPGWVAALWPRTNEDVLAELAADQRLGGALSRARDWAQ
jgi:hypothetical protein